MTIRKACFGFLFFFSYSFCAFAANNVASISNYYGVSTFECIGVYCNYTGDDNCNSVCSLYYKEASSLEWKKGHPLYTDTARTQYRGSVVNLRPNTIYDIRLTVYDADGAPAPVTFQDTTWNETFPIGQIIYVSSQNTMFTASVSGTPQGYTLYMPSPGEEAVIDVDSTATTCVTVTGNYIILRGLKLMDGKWYGIKVNYGKHDIVIENCEITSWGPGGIGNPGTGIVFNYQDASGIYVDMSTYRIIIQNNIIHHPRGCSNPWTPHPAGPQTISFCQTNGNHVIRYNHCYSDSGHYYNDVIGGGENGNIGNVNKDSDIYGNIVSHCFDDALEIEGNNENTRIWGNIIHHTYQALATCVVLKGPCYMWRNVIMDGYIRLKVMGDAGAFKSGDNAPDGPGPRYIYHNSMVYITGEVNPRSIAITQCQDILDKVTCKNNILDCVGSPLSGNYKNSHSFYDYNLYTKPPDVLALWELHKVLAKPAYSRSGQYNYFLAAGSPGIDQGEIIPNFNDGYSGNAPDIGAFETGGDTLRYGPSGIIKESGFVKLLSYSLQTFPNPFFHSTTIQFGSGSHGKNQIEIYSMSGQLLFSSSAGKSDVMWNGLDRLGLPVAPGQYLVRIKTSDQSLQKMITKMR